MRVSSSARTSLLVVIVHLLLLYLGVSNTFVVVIKAEEEPDIMDQVIIPDVPPINETDTTVEVIIRVPILNGTSNKGCPCVDISSIISPITSRKCTLPITGENGVKFSIDGPCVQYSYGSSQCLQHDLLHDPSCLLDDIGDNKHVEAYCFRPWCYINAEACMKNSFERIYRSDYFSFDSGIDLYYSYSTCNSTADDWLAAKDAKTNDAILTGASILATVPMYQLPMMYKRDTISGEIITVAGDEYYDNSLPYEGVYINFVNEILKVSNGDINNITYTHRSKSSSLLYPDSSFTAAVQDIEDGLVDMAVGPFWITGQRLKMAAFTIPIIYDKTFLVIPRPGSSDKLRDQVLKVLAPFSKELWTLLLFVILAAALLSVWFSDQSELPRNRSGKGMKLAQMKNSLRPTRRKKVYARLALDAFLEKGTNFFSAGVDNDAAASLPNKFLMFGFGFFILITVSAYVANLAAFLTRNVHEIKSMEGAVASKMIICAHPAIQSELEIAWPKANFYFTESGQEFYGMLEDYRLGRCDVMAVGWEDASMDLIFRELICEMDLVFTDSVIIEIPIAFPVRSDLASGFSYWMYRLERFSGLSIDTMKETYAEEYGRESCNVEISEGVNELSNDYDKITVRMMFLPLMLFLGCSVLAVLMQVLHQRHRKDGHRSLAGRKSGLDIISIKPGGKGTASVVGSRSRTSANGSCAADRRMSELLRKMKMMIEDEDIALTLDLEKSVRL